MKTKLDYSPDHHTATLTFTSLEPNDAGKYRCEARNNVGQAETSCKLRVNGKNCFKILIKIFIVYLSSNSYG